MLTPEWLQNVADAASDEAPLTVSASRPPGWRFSPNVGAQRSVLRGFTIKAVGREAVRVPTIPVDWRPVELLHGVLELLPPAGSLTAP